MLLYTSKRFIAQVIHAAKTSPVLYIRDTFKCQPCDVAYLFRKLKDYPVTSIVLCGFYISDVFVLGVNAMSHLTHLTLKVCACTESMLYISPRIFLTVGVSYKFFNVNQDYLVCCDVLHIHVTDQSDVNMSIVEQFVSEARVLDIKLYMGWFENEYEYNDVELNEQIQSILTSKKLELLSDDMDRWG